uniref:PH domain-containing protein n=1 Tax=Steinernema glaseri TaxID=37863 RepID=A0A1I7ZLH8_9BILA
MASKPVKLLKAKVAPQESMLNVKEKKGILRSLSFQFTPFGRSNRKGTKEIHAYDITPGCDSSPQQLPGDFGPITGVQCQGILLKKYKRKNHRAKWSKKFFILKECFLLYYAAKCQKQYERTRKIDLHPRGIIPLIGCSIVSGGDIGQKHCLLITHPQFDQAFIICARDQNAQEMWLTSLREATKISYKNTMVGETMIRELESKGLKLNEENKIYEERLKSEAEARQEERNKNESLEKAKEQLEKEREKLIKTTKKLKDDLNNVRNDLKLTNEAKRTLEQEKFALTSKTQCLVTNMDALNLEKSKIEEQMSKIIREREKFLLENQNLSTVTCQLKNRLMEIESKANCINTEKEKVQSLLSLNEQKTIDLEKERQYYNHKTKELLQSLKEVNEQKELTETELRNEAIARAGAEKQLQAAEKALEHLEMALKLTGAQMTELQEHIMPDVHKLREFFEQCANDSRLDANKPVIMKNAIYARRSLRRSKTKLRSSLRKGKSQTTRQDSIDSSKLELEPKTLIHLDPNSVPKRLPMRSGHFISGYFITS